MSEVDVEVISKYLLDADYVVRVLREGDEVILLLPERKIEPVFEKTEVTFRFTEDGFVTDEEKHTICPYYARRLGVECAIIMMCNVWKYPVSLVYIGDENRENILDILPIELSDEDAEKEAILLDAVSQYNDISFREMKQLCKDGGVGDAFVALESILHDLWVSSNLKENEDNE
jgi:hypothetical protein